MTKMCCTMDGMFARIPAVILLACLASANLDAQSDEARRIGDATTVMYELLGANDSEISRSILADVEAIAVFPGTIKGAFLVGGHRGRGIISAYDHDSGEWSLPAFLTLTGASFGFQIGGQSIDVVMLVMNKRGMEQFLSNQFKLGADASVAAGPVGRRAEAATDIQLRAEILGYSRARGLFAGVSLEGSTVQQDRDANERYYGYPHRTQAIVAEGEASKPDDDYTLTRWRDWLAENLRSSP